MSANIEQCKQIECIFNQNTKCTKLGIILNEKHVCVDFIIGGKLQ